MQRDINLQDLQDSILDVVLVQVHTLQKEKLQFTVQCSGKK